MRQQIFSPTYTRKTFQRLSDWLYAPKEQVDHEDRKERLVKFHRDDTEIFKLSAEAFWETATAVNQPWGRSNTNPTYYLHMDCREKVRNEHIISRIGFFFSDCILITHMRV